MEKPPLAFVIDDEPDMLGIITFALETQGFETVEFRSAEAAWRALQHDVPDLVVLDIMLPGVSGLSLCRRIKARWSTPVILVTAKGTVDDRITGLEAEADDYITKPFHPRELALRAARLVRRPLTSAPVEAGGFRVSTASQEFSVDGVRLVLTLNEFRIIAMLIDHAGAVIDYKELLAAAWGEGERVGDREMIRAAIYRLRHKIDQVSPGRGSAIVSVRGRGYLLRA